MHGAGAQTPAWAQRVTPSAQGLESPLQQGVVAALGDQGADRAAPREEAPAQHRRDDEAVQACV